MIYTVFWMSYKIHMVTNRLDYNCDSSFGVKGFSYDGTVLRYLSRQKKINGAQIIATD